MKIVREIPMWGVLGVLAMLGAQAVALFYGQKRLEEHMAEVRTEMRSLTAASITREREMATLQLRVEDLGRRVIDLERRVKP